VEDTNCHKTLESARCLVGPPAQTLEAVIPPQVDAHEHEELPITRPTSPRGRITKEAGGTAWVLFKRGEAGGGRESMSVPHATPCFEGQGRTRQARMAHSRKAVGEPGLMMPSAVSTSVSGSPTIDAVTRTGRGEKRGRRPRSGA
jgi:hypothetical protein